MGYRLFSSKPTGRATKAPIISDKTCHQPGYKFKHVLYELLQLRSIVTLACTVIFLIAFLTGRLEHWDTSTALFIPILSMILNSLFRKDKGD